MLVVGWSNISSRAVQYLLLHIDAMYITHRSPNNNYDILHSMSCVSESALPPAV